MKHVASLVAVLACCGLTRAQCDVWLPTPGRSELAAVLDLDLADPDGDGRVELFAAHLPTGNEPRSLRRWDGDTWRPIDATFTGVRSLHGLTRAAGGLGAGSLLVGGSFVNTNNQARVIGVWNGVDILPIGPSTQSSFSSNPRVETISSWDPDGAGPVEPWIVVGGTFSRFGGTNTQNVAG